MLSRYHGQHIYIVFPRGEILYVDRSSKDTKWYVSWLRVPTNALIRTALIHLFDAINFYMEYKYCNYLAWKAEKAAFKHQLPMSKAQAQLSEKMAWPYLIY